MIQPPVGLTCDNVIPDGSPDPASAVIRLCNFKTGQSDLLEDHKTGLLNWIMNPGYTASRAMIDIVGLASKALFRNRSGDNWSLSIARANAVQKYLQDNFFSLFTPASSAARVRVVENPGDFHLPHVVMGVGDTQSGADATGDHNHGFYRAVEVKLFAQGKVAWKPPMPLRRGYTPVPSNRFVFEAVEFASADMSLPKPLSGVSAGANCLIFGIHDLKNQRRRYFWFGGPELNVSTPKLPPISFSAEHHSTPIPFNTAVPFFDMEDFTGGGNIYGEPGVTFADMISVGGALCLSWTPKAYRDKGVTTPLLINFSFSRGFGVSLSSGGPGSVHLLPTSFRPTVYSR